MPSEPVLLLVKRRYNRRSHKQHQRQSITGRLGLGCGAIASLLLVVAVLAAALAYASLTADLPSHQALPILLDAEAGALLQPTTLYDRSGQHVLLEINNPGMARRFLSTDPDLPHHFSPYLIQVSLALLDDSFWHNPGFAWWKLTDPQPLTLAEHLVDDLLLEADPPGLRRTLRMRLLAAQLVATYGRSQVLEWYLNSAPFGNRAYGAESASQLYLGKSASALNLAEAALLVAVMAAPALNPLDTPAAAIERQHEALDELLARGAINATEHQQALNDDPGLKAAATPTPGLASNFTDLVIEQLSRQFGEQRVERGGLRVLTTLDYDLQLQLDCGLRNQLRRLQGEDPAITMPTSVECQTARLLPTLPPGSDTLPPQLAAAALLLDLEKGQVLAYAGAFDSNGQRGYYRHQPGSMLTPFVAVAAFARGFAPASLVWDIPETAPPIEGVQLNPDGEYHGPQRLRLALANDYLIPLAGLLDQLGAINVWRQAQPLGLGRLGQVNDPLGLLYRGGNLSLLEMAQAYSVFANLGFLVGEPNPVSDVLTPLMVLEVEDSAGIHWKESQTPQRRSALSPELAYLVHHVLADEAARWQSLGYPNPLEVGRPVGAKVGQAAEGAQVWTIGYTPQRLAAVWLGFPEETIDPPKLQTRYAAGIWHALIQYASRELPPAGWQAPAGIRTLTVCDPSGKLPTVDCPLTVEEVFIEGFEPVEYDTLYRQVQINRETGRLATVFTPLALIQEEVFLVVPPEAQAWARRAGLLLPPSEYDDIFVPSVLPDVNILHPPIFSYVRGKVALRGSAAGEDFASYSLQAGQGLNPRNWQQIGEESTAPVQDGTLGRWDTTSLEDGLYAVRLTVLRSDQRLDTAVIQVTVDNTPPQVQIVHPVPQQRFVFPTERQITFRVDTEDVSEIQLVRWYLNDRLHGESSQAPFSYVWNGDPGRYTLTARAVDRAGNSGESQPVNFSLER